MKQLEVSILGQVYMLGCPEGGEALLADPSLIRRNYREAVTNYLHEIDDLIRTTGIDYQRVKLSEKYDDVLAKFLLSRVQKKGGR